MSEIITKTLTAGRLIPPDVVHLAHDDDVLDLVEVEVGGSQRHHQVTEPDQRGINVSKQTNLNTRILSNIFIVPLPLPSGSKSHHNVAIENGHSGLFLVLQCCN